MSAAPRSQRIRQLFDAALELRAPQRSSFLAEHCGDDKALLREVTALVTAAEEPVRDLGVVLGGLRSTERTEADEEDRKVALEEGLRHALSGHYELAEELGEGGAAVVYRAKDLRHGRDVAVKVLRRVPGEFGPDRFQSEIRIVAGLAHPHVLPLHDSGEVDGRPYYVMPLVTGESLRDRLNREGPLPIREALAIARDVAEALAYSHRQGVVHRDIKPENILLSDGGAVVADFGIARTTGKGARRMTTPGLTLGTPAYMSPEVRAGHEHGPLSDLYALGRVLEEMLTGDRPKQDGLHPADPPEGLPHSLKSLLARSLAPNPEERVQGGEAFAEALNDTLGELSAQTRAEKTPGGAPSRLRPGLGWILGAALAAGVGALILLNPGRDGPPLRSVAVLPFDNATGDPGREPLVRGLTELVRNELAGFRGILVLSGTSTMKYAGADKTAPAIGRELGADALVEATVTAWGPSIQLVTRLIRTRDDVTLWSDSYRIPLAGAPTLQRQVAERVADAILIALPPAEGRSGTSQRDEIDPVAFDLYVEGLGHLLKGGPQRSGKSIDYVPHLDTSIMFLDSATALEPNWTDAWVALARAHHWRASSAHPLIDEPYELRAVVASDYEATRTAAAHALELDGRNAEGYRALAFVQAFYDGDYAIAEANFRRAERLKPDGDVWGHGLAWLRRGRPDSAVAILLRARRIDPNSALLFAQIGQGLACEGHFAAADSVLERSATMEVHMDRVVWRRALVAAWRGRLAEVVDGLEDESDSDLLGYAYGKLGRTAEAHRIIDLRAASGYASPDTWIGLGDVDRGLEEFSHQFDRIHRHPRCWRPWYPELERDPRLLRILGTRFPQ